MPLFMDFHKGLSLSVEDVKRAHIADEAVQSKYGVVYHQFWINEAEGTVFCLMEGPDKEACAAVHREAHGQVACSIVEVSVGFYKLFMGDGHRVHEGHVFQTDGTMDIGIRNVLVLNIEGITTLATPSEYRSLKSSYKAKDLAVGLLYQYQGREVNWLHDNSLIAVFNSPIHALQCAMQTQAALLDKTNHAENDEWNIRFRIGLSAGQPVTESGEFFSETTSIARRLCSLAHDNALLISHRFQEYCDVTELIRASRLKEKIRLLTDREEEFIASLYSISEEKLADENFTVDTLSRNIGMSRPQLYRKMISITGKAPNDFIRDLRMEKALSLIKKKAGNISEIALEVGYNNPSYFAKCFQVRFGCTPSRYAAT